MWILTTNGTLINTDCVVQIAVDALSGTIVYAELPCVFETIATQMRAKGQLVVATCQSEFEAGEILAVIGRMLAMKQSYLDVPDCLRKRRAKSQEDAR